MFEAKKTLVSGYACQHGTACFRVLLGISCITKGYWLLVILLAVLTPPQWGLSSALGFDLLRDSWLLLVLGISCLGRDDLVELGALDQHNLHLRLGLAVLGREVELGVQLCMHAAHEGAEVSERGAAGR